MTFLSINIKGIRLKLSWILHLDNSQVKTLEDLSEEPLIVLIEKIQKAERKLMLVYYLE